MVNINIGYNKKPRGLEYAIAQRGKKHGLLVPEFLDDEAGEEHVDAECAIDEEQGSLTKVIVPILIIKFADYVLQAVEGGEHDHEGYAQVCYTDVLFLDGEVGHCACCTKYLSIQYNIT